MVLPPTNLAIAEPLAALAPPPPDFDPAPELAHRLDRETSGCLLLAKTRPALLALHRLLREGDMEKRYLALVAGIVQFGKGIGQLAAGDKQLEAVGNVRVFLGPPRQRRYFHRVMGDKGRLNELGLHNEIEELGEELAVTFILIGLDT